MAESKRGRALTIFAVLFAVLAVSNLLKPFQFGGEQTGFVLFGSRLTGTANAIVGPLFGLYLLVYAFGIWRMKRYAMLMAQVYAGYVILNLVLFSQTNPKPPGLGYAVFTLLYAVVAIGVSLSSAVVLTRRRAELT